MRTSLLRISAILALTSVMVLAQQRTPPDPAEMVQHHIDHLTKALSLTPAQQQQATSLLTQVQNNFKTLQDQLRTAHESLQAAIQKNDTAAIEQISNSIGNLTAQQTITHAKAMATFYQTLTPEQQGKFTQMFSEHGPRMHGHGGMGGPPPGASFR
ncbi:MAG: Spy/CpxP family protein refolding chaperone [Candidatus Angelobacter sp.]